MNEIQWTWSDLWQYGKRDNTRPNLHEESLHVFLHRAIHETKQPATRSKRGEGCLLINFFGSKDNEDKGEIFLHSSPEGTEWSSHRYIYTAYSSVTNTVQCAIHFMKPMATVVYTRQLDCTRKTRSRLIWKITRSSVVNCPDTVQLCFRVSSCLQIFTFNVSILLF
jgi:hypothetical protein